MIDGAIRLAPDDHTNWNIAGEIARLSGDLQGAIERFSRALSLDSSSVDALINLGVTQEALGLYDQAVESLGQALSRSPHSSLAWYNLGNTLFRAKRYDQSLHAYQSALSISPNYPEALNNFGALLTRVERFTEAIEIFEALTLIKPDFYDGLYNYAEALALQGEYARAVEVYQRALERAPEEKRGQTLARQANAYREHGERSKALAVIQKAYMLDPESRDVLHARVNLELDCGNFKTARGLVEKLIARDPTNLSARLCLTMLQMPTIYETDAEIAQARVNYSAMLAELESMSKNTTAETAPAIEEILGNNQPFFLPYQGMDCAELQRRYGLFVADVMSKAVPLDPPRARAVSSHGRVRIGIVSGFFRNHSVYKMPVRGWLKTLDRAKFELFCYHTQKRVDQYTQEAASLCDKFAQGPKSSRQWAAEIRADSPDLVIFPEIGMDPMTGKLAALRLAPIQATSWGHPVTSGYPTIDYFISGDAMEPPDGASHYTERLVRLPGIGVHYSPLDTRPTPLSREELGIGDDAIFLWCCQSNYKYLPQYDWIYAEIAARLPGARFGFITLLPESEASAVFRTRLRQALVSRGIDANERIRFFPALSPEQFTAIAGLADLCLDSIEWSGCNSSLEVLSQGTPIVAHRGRFMRGRHSAAILELLGCKELVADSFDDYIRLAVELATDRERRNFLAARIRENLPKLCNDPAPIRQLETLLDTWTRSPKA